MPTITILPSGIKIEVEPGTTLLKAALENDLCWPHTCGGKAQCTTCAYILVKGGENCSNISRLEQHALVTRKGRHVLNQKMRLACQTVIKGDMIIQKNIMII